MGPRTKRVLFYGGMLAIVTVMCQDAFRQALLTLLGDNAAESLFAFLRTNVEAPISIVFVALYLDLVLSRRRAPAAAPAAAPASSPSVSEP